MKEVILEVIERLDQIEYADTAEHLYDAVKMIKRHLDDDNLDDYIDDFLWGLESSTVFDFSFFLPLPNGTEIEKLSKFIRESRVACKRENKLNNLGI